MAVTQNLLQPRKEVTPTLKPWLNKSPSVMMVLKP